MATDDEIKAVVVAKLHRKEKYNRAVRVENAAKFGVETHDRGRAKDLIHDMAADDACPVVYKPKSGTNAVYLENDSEDWVADWIRRHDESALPWDLK
ncbi:MULTISPECIES: hypothetical protein [Halorussus]|uniref:hypothetical protein n=1 Tax=Halorussus TaxID=1070314 RepID=UPI00209E3D1A|nr:hypothetical protein [Halorussus vallis]USZ78690.1 hypothetical protein NGM07_24580 [Halorussus vallis]